ncbi:PAS domain-containing protein [bacterium]|nr:PAS domain-containing protein [bacterium]
MFRKIPREQVQTISFFLFAAGVALVTLGGEHFSTLGFPLMAGSIWFIMMSESILLAKVQNEMSSALEALGKRRESEIQDLLYFLRESKLALTPLQNIDVCKRALLSKVQFPAFVMSPALGIVSANERFTNLLGYRPREIDGWPIARINNKVVMSEVGQLVSQKPYHDMKAMWMRYVYVHKDGSHIKGSLDINKLDDGGYFIVFYPDIDSIVSSQEISSFLCESERSCKHDHDKKL